MRENLKADKGKVYAPPKVMSPASHVNSPGMSGLLKNLVTPKANKVPTSINGLFGLKDDPKPVNPNINGVPSRTVTLDNLLRGGFDHSLDATKNDAGFIAKYQPHHNLSRIASRNPGGVAARNIVPVPVPVSHPSVTSSGSGVSSHSGGTGLVGNSAPPVGLSNPAPAMPAPVSGGHPGAPVTAPVDNFGKLATQSVDTELNPQLGALARQLADQTTQYNTQSADATKHGALRQSDLTELYKRLGGITQGLQNTQDSNFDATSKADQERYAQLQSQLGSTYQGATGDTNAELARLGIEGVGPAATASLGRDQKYLQGLTGVDAANSAANLNTQHGGFDNLMSLLRGNGATEGSVQIGQSQRDTAKTLADLTSAYNSSSNDLSGKKSDLAATRAGKIAELTHTLQSEAATAQATQQQQEFNRQLAESKLGLTQAQLDQTAKYQSGQLALGQQNANTAATRATQAGQAAAAAATAKAAKTAATAATAAKVKPGIASAERDIAPGPHHDALISELRYLFTNNYVEQDATKGKPFVTKFKPDDPGLNQHLVGWLTRNPGMTQDDINAIKHAVAVYNNKG